MNKYGNPYLGRWRSAASNVGYLVQLSAEDALNQVHKKARRMNPQRANSGSGGSQRVVRINPFQLLRCAGQKSAPRERRLVHKLYTVVYLLQRVPRFYCKLSSIGSSF